MELKWKRGGDGEDLWEEGQVGAEFMEDGRAEERGSVGLLDGIVGTHRFRAGRRGVEGWSPIHI